MPLCFVAFGLLSGFGSLFVPIALIVTVIGIYFQRKGYLKGKALKIGVAFYVGGAIGNAIDRILFSEVTDFIHFQFRQGILNFADYALSIGVLLILIDILVLETRKKKAT